MRVGDIEGRNVVYRLTAARTNSGRVINFSGTIVLEPREQLLFFKNETLPEIWNAGGRKDRFFDDLYPTSDGMLVNFHPRLGWGTMYFTDRRILFLRRPDIDQLRVIYGGSSPSNVPTEVSSKARSIAAMGGMEFFEIPHEDVLRYERGAYSARIWFRKSSESECVIRLPLKVFDRIVPLLDARGVPGRRKLISTSEIPMFWLSLVALVSLVAAKGLLDNDEGYILMSFAISAFVLLLFVFLALPTRTLKKVKAAKWDSGRGHRIGKWVGYSVAGIFFGVGTIVSYLMESLAPIVFSLFCGGVFLVAGLVVGSDWRKISRYQSEVPYRYECPSCHGGLTRRDISCAQCGAPVWWLLGKTPRHSYRKDARRLS